MTVKNQLLKNPRFGERLVVLSFDIIRKNFSSFVEIRLIPWSHIFRDRYNYCRFAKNDAISRRLSS